MIAARCRYRQTSRTYKDFSKAMELPEQRQRVTIDGLGNIGVGKWKNPSRPVAKSGGSGIMETGKSTGQQKLKSGRFVEAGSDHMDFVADCQQRGVTPTVRLLSCNTGNTTDTGDCFAQLLANELGHDVTAPTNLLYAEDNGIIKVGLLNDGDIKPFYSRKN